MLKTGDWGNAFVINDVLTIACGWLVYMFLVVAPGRRAPPAAARANGGGLLGGKTLRVRVVLKDDTGAHGAVGMITTRHPSRIRCLETKTAGGGVRPR